jgi:hypothetical protein
VTVFPLPLSVVATSNIPCRNNGLWLRALLTRDPTPTVSSEIELQYRHVGVRARAILRGDGAMSADGQTRVLVYRQSIIKHT